jgi:hypothetical protein
MKKVKLPRKRKKRYIKDNGRKVCIAQKLAHECLNELDGIRYDNRFPCWDKTPGIYANWKLKFNY